MWSEKNTDLCSLSHLKCLSTYIRWAFNACLISSFFSKLQYYFPHEDLANYFTQNSCKEPEDRIPTHSHHTITHCYTCPQVLHLVFCYYGWTSSQWIPLSPPLLYTLSSCIGIPSLILCSTSIFLSFCHCSVAQACPTLCDLMDCSMPGFPVLHCLPGVCSKLCALNRGFSSLLNHSCQYLNMLSQSPWSHILLHLSVRKSKVS